MKSYTWRAGILKSDLAPTTRHILLTLSCHINDAGESAFPSINLMAEETGLSRKAVITHLAIAKEKGWLVVRRHGFGDRRWARNEYYPAFPEGGEAGSPPHQQGGERRTPPRPRGGEPNDREVVNDVHSNYSYELPSKEGEGSGTTPRAPACDPQAEKPEGRGEGIENEVERFRGLHLNTCGLATVPPLAVIREILQAGKAASLIEDIYQRHGGGVLKYRQRDIVDDLIRLRDGVDRPVRRLSVVGMSATERRQEATFEAARKFAGGEE